MATGDGVNTVDFGVFPGSLHATKAIAGQVGITADSRIEVWIDTKDSADHSADEHQLEPLRCGYRDVIADVGAGGGFTAVVTYAGEHPMDERPFIRDPNDPKRNSPRAYGVFNIAFAWKTP